MRRLVVFGSVALLLTACAKSVPDVPDLSAEDVLERAVVAVQSLQSATYEISGSFSANANAADAMKMDGTFALSGILESGGDAVQSLLHADVDIKNSLLSGIQLSGSIETIIGKDGASYLYVHSLETSPENAIVNEHVISLLSNKWLQLPEQEAETTTGMVPPIAPDPLMLKEQAKLVKITREYRPSFIEEYPVYHYGVELNKEELILLLRQRSEERNIFFDEESVQNFLSTFVTKGEIWVDATTFFVRAIAWDVRWNDVYNVHASFSMTLRDHNKAHPIQYPTDAVPFSPIELLDRAVVPLPSQYVEQLPSDFESQLIDELLNDSL